MWGEGWREESEGEILERCWGGRARIHLETLYFKHTHTHTHTHTLTFGGTFRSHSTCYFHRCMLRQERSTLTKPSRRAHHSAATITVSLSEPRHGVCGQHFQIPAFAQNLTRETQTPYYSTLRTGALRRRRWTASLRDKALKLGAWGLAPLPKASNFEQLTGRLLVPSRARLLKLLSA